MKPITEYEPGKFYCYTGHTGMCTWLTIFKHWDDGYHEYFVDVHQVSEIPYKKNKFSHFELNEDEIMTHVVLTNI